MINACAASSLLIFGVGLVTLFSFSIALDPSGCVSIEKARIVANTCVCDAGYACRHISGEPGHTVDYNCAHGLLHGVVGEDPSFVLDKIPTNCNTCVCRRGNPTLPRLQFASVPRSGNSWMRKVIEVVTSLATESVFPEAFTIEDPDHPPRRLTQQATLSNLTGLYGSICGLSHLCDTVSRIKGGAGPVITKTHSPFLLTKEARRLGLQGGSDAGVGMFFLLVVRNPLDNYDAWKRYRKQLGREVESLKEFVDMWIAHHTYWQDTEPFKSIPKYVFRFEDLGSTKKRVEIMQQFLDVSGLSISLGLSPAKIEKAVNDPRLPIKLSENHANHNHLVTAFLKYSWEDIAYVRGKARHLLERFGYMEMYNYWSVMRLEERRQRARLHAQVVQNWASWPPQKE